MDGQRYRVLISDKARQMMKAHVSFLAEVNPQAAEKLRVSLMEGIRSLAQMPERCPYLDEEDRRSAYTQVVSGYIRCSGRYSLCRVHCRRQTGIWVAASIKKVKNRMKKDGFFRPSFLFVEV